MFPIENNNIKKKKKKKKKRYKFLLNYIIFSYIF